MEPGESKEDIFSATAHDVEEMFLSDPFDVCVKGVSIADGSGFVWSLIDVPDSNGRSKFLNGELVFSDELPVYTGDISARVY